MYIHKNFSVPYRKLTFLLFSANQINGLGNERDERGKKLNDN